MIPEEREPIVARLRAALEIHSPALEEGLRASLVERTFPVHPRFKRTTAPPLDEGDTVRGIHVIFYWPDWHVTIGGLSGAGACKAGVRFPFAPRTKTPWDDDPDPECVVHATARWVLDAWRAVRHVAPDLRGFFGEHDGGRKLDLDSGQLVDEDIGMGPL